MVGPAAPSPLRPEGPGEKQAFGFVDDRSTENHHGIPGHHSGGDSILSYATVKHVGRIWRTEIQTRVRLDLNSARAAYDNHLTDMLRFLQAASISGMAVPAGDLQNPTKDLLQRIHRESGLDMLTLLSPQGNVIFRAHNPSNAGDTINDNPLIRKIRENNTAVTGTLMLTAEQLRHEGGPLADRARFELLETQAARPRKTPSEPTAWSWPRPCPYSMRTALWPQSCTARICSIVAMKSSIPSATKCSLRISIKASTSDGDDFQGDLRISTNVMRQTANVPSARV